MVFIQPTKQFTLQFKTLIEILESEGYDILNVIMRYRDIYYPNVKIYPLFLERLGTE